MREFIDYSVQRRTNFEADMNFVICSPQNDKNRYKFRQQTTADNTQSVPAVNVLWWAKSFTFCLCRLILSYNFPLLTSLFCQ